MFTVFYLHGDHEERLKDQRCFEFFEQVEIESEDIGEQEDAADVDGERTYRFGLVDEAVLVEVSHDWSDGHAWSKD